MGCPRSFPDDRYLCAFTKECINSKFGLQEKKEYFSNYDVKNVRKLKTILLKYIMREAKDQ